MAEAAAGLDDVAADALVVEEVVEAAEDPAADDAAVVDLHDFIAQAVDDADLPDTPRSLRSQRSQRSQMTHFTDPAAAAAYEHNRRMQEEIVETVCNLVSQRPAMSSQLLLLRQDEIQKFSVSLTQAPPIFRQVYDTQLDFSWSLAGFNFVVGSFYRGGVRTRESQYEITGSCLAGVCWSVLGQFVKTRHRLWHQSLVAFTACDWKEMFHSSTFAINWGFSITQVGLIEQARDLLQRLPELSSVPNVWVRVPRLPMWGFHK